PARSAGRQPPRSTPYPQTTPLRHRLQSPPNRRKNQPRSGRLTEELGAARGTFAAQKSCGFPSAKSNGSNPQSDTPRIHCMSGVSARLVGIGLVAGVFSALFGVGGGLVIVPLLLLLAAYPPHQATATSLGAVAITALAGVIAYALRHDIRYAYAAL